MYWRLDSRALGRVLIDFGASNVSCWPKQTQTVLQRSGAHAQRVALPVSRERRRSSGFVPRARATFGARACRTRGRPVCYQQIPDAEYAVGMMQWLPYRYPKPRRP
jgi:hypothetical protein